MLKFSEETIQLVRAIDIERLVGEYVDLRGRAGSRELWGCCPFHNENTPSFKIDIEKGFFKCFGCDAKGDVVSFIMRKLGFSYPDAVVFLAEKFGINIQYVGSEAKNSKEIIDLHEEIQTLLRNNLYSEGGKSAKDYILNRSFNDEDLDLFGIGYCPPRLDYSKILSKYSQDVVLGCGYFKENNYGGVNPRFFNRLTLPIKSITGSIAAFAGRSLDDTMPKYLNSAESELFHKRGTLFNMDKAKDAVKKNGCIIVEGYFDVMRLYKYGYRNAAAPMGTALTIDQINFAKRYSSEITVIFDGDEAGEKASNRSLEIFIGAGVFPKAVFLPKDHDPDSFLLEKGKDAFAKLYEKRSDLLMDVGKRLAAGTDGDFNKKLSHFQSVKRMLAKIQDPHYRDYYFEAMADVFGLKKENIADDVTRLQNKTTSPKVAIGKKTTEIQYACEMDFIACLTRLPMDVIVSLITDMTEEMFNDEKVKQIFKKILEVSCEIEDINEIIGESDGLLVDFAMRQPKGDDYYAISLINKKGIEKNYLMKKQKELIEKQKIAGITDDERLKLTMEVITLTQKIAAMN